MCAIRKVLSGQIHLSPEMGERVMQRFAQTYTPVEVYRLFGEGLNTRMIAEKLAVGENTISTFRQRIKKKLNAKDFTELYCQAARWVQEQG